MRSRWLGGTARCAWVFFGAGLLFGALPAHAQDTPPIDPEWDDIAIDPDAPLDPLPGIDVEWPDLPGEEPEEATVAPEPDAPGEPAPDEEVALEEEFAEEEFAPLADFTGGRHYRLEIEGLDPALSEELRPSFDALSTLEQGDGEATNAAQVDRRARADAEILSELMRSRGYYAAIVTPEVRARPDGLLVILVAEPGPLYRFETVELPGLAEAGAREASELRLLYGIEEGDAVVAEKVIAGREALVEALGRRGYATAEVGEQQVVIDHESDSARLVQPVTPGPVGHFGAIRVTGEPPFPSRHVGHIARFEEGQRYDSELVSDLRRALIRTGLVSDVTVDPVPVDGGETVDVEVTLAPAPYRTIAGEIGYGTGEGFRLEASWQHRNFFNPEGAVTLRGVAGTQEQLVAAELRRSNWKMRDRTLLAQVIAGSIDRDAYRSRYVGIGAGIERLSNFLWQKPWTWSLESELIATKERDRFDEAGLLFERSFFIAAVPASLRYDGTDDLLDPQKGFRLGGRISPELSVELASFSLGGETVEAGARETYLKAQIDASAYHPVGENTVIAGRVRLGTIVGAEFANIAPSRRHYAGGGGSVRGYGYQRLGPRDALNDPLGGRSLVEFSLEARVRFGNFGVVPFIDGGRLSRDVWPGTDDWQFGVGIGARYYSSFGPIRIDIGTPINRQEGDSRIAVVVSLGQAF
ncbi:autotransporter assembly complex protein TamA [Sphingomicrobium nitratireducens]|uniref:autotransporter assembly complex protein TamA n=1 Tax=Sphingomicrobium nitratireducens TaxID=2964666 RepID=UPI0022408FEC|nr:BamA/TamA family outer membrane protein [Sphingomicrobium nitratireducens]